MDYLARFALAELLLPPLGPFLALTFAFVLALRFRRVGIVLAALAVLANFALALPWLAERMHGAPNVPAAILPPHPAADAIVVLGGGRYLRAPEYGGDTASNWSLERTRYAAKLHRETGLPILVSGGRPGNRGSRSEAEIIRDILQNEFRVPVRWIEAESHDTHQNVRNSVALLQREGIRRVLVVTHASHMPRVLALFADTPIVAVPMATGFPQPVGDSWFAWTPSFYGIGANREWLRERLARADPF